MCALEGFSRRHNNLVEMDVHREHPAVFEFLTAKRYHTIEIHRRPPFVLYYDVCVDSAITRSYPQRIANKRGRFRVHPMAIIQLCKWAYPIKSMVKQRREMSMGMTKERMGHIIKHCYGNRSKCTRWVPHSLCNGIKARQQYTDLRRTVGREMNKMEEFVSYPIVTENES